MPKILCEVPETVESVTRPVVLDIARRMFENTSIKEDDLYILYPGTIERGQQPGASIGAKGKDPVKFPYGDQITIEVSEAYAADRMLANTNFRPENNFIFRDDRIETLIRPVYGFTEVTISFKYRAKDETQAYKWRDLQRNKFTQNRDGPFLHDIKYHYLIPEEQLIILKELHRMRELVAPYGEDFETYLKSCTTQRMHWLTNLAGAEGRWGIAETQMEVQAWFNWEGAPEQGSRSPDDGPSWEISFEYHFHYDKPLATSMFYPLMIHNQLVDQKYRPGPDEMPPYQVQKQLRRYSLSAKMFAYFDATNQIYRNTQTQGYTIPAFDEFLPRTVIPGTMRVFTVMLQLDLTAGGNPHNLFNLKDIITDELEFDEDMFCCLDKEWPYMCKPFQSVFDLSLYQSADLIAPGFIAIDKDYNVTATQDFNPREYYHVRLSIHRDWRMVNEAGIKRLQDCPDCLNKLLDTIDPTLAKRGLLPGDIDGQWVASDALSNAIDAVNQGVIATGDGQIRQFNTVETFAIRSSREANLPQG